MIKYSKKALKREVKLMVNEEIEKTLKEKTKEKNQYIRELSATVA